MQNGGIAVTMLLSRERATVCCITIGVLVDSLDQQRHFEANIVCPREETQPV